MSGERLRQATLSEPQADFGAEPARATAPSPLAPEATSVPPSHIDRYEIRKELGRGAMGSVFAAWDPKLCREVAIKIVATQQRNNAKGRARFLREARAIAAIGQANVVQIFDYSGLDSESLYLVMEKLEGRDLWELMHSHRLFPEAIAALVGHELCLALEAAHQVGIIHRDLKPENVFLTHGGRVVLTDFGIVKAIADDAAVEGYTERTEVIGTPGFMAPELLRGRELTPMTDIFALGALLYNLVTLQMPYEGASPMALLQAAKAGDYIDPRRFQPQLSQAFCDLLRMCLKDQPEDRPATAGEVRVHLKGILDDLAEHSFGDDLLAWLQDPMAFADVSHHRAVAHALSEMTVAAARGQADAAFAHKERLVALDPFNNEWQAILAPLLAPPAGEAPLGHVPEFVDDLLATLPALRIAQPLDPELTRGPPPSALRLAAAAPAAPVAPARTWPRAAVAVAFLAVTSAGAWQIAQKPSTAWQQTALQPARDAAAWAQGPWTSAEPSAQPQDDQDQEFSCGPLHVEVVTDSAPTSLVGETLSAPEAQAAAVPTNSDVQSEVALNEPAERQTSEASAPAAPLVPAQAQPIAASAELTAWAAAPIAAAASETASPAADVRAPAMADASGAQDGELSIDVDGRGAWLIVDGHGVGHVNQRELQLSPGRHRVVLVMGPTSILRRWLTIRPGQKHTWRANHAFVR